MSPQLEQQEPCDHAQRLQGGVKVFELSVNFYKQEPAQIFPFHQILQGATIRMEEEEKEP